MTFLQLIINAAQFQAQTYMLGASYDMENEVFVLPSPANHYCEDFAADTRETLEAAVKEWAIASLMLKYFPKAKDLSLELHSLISSGCASGLLKRPGRKILLAAEEAVSGLIQDRLNGMSSLAVAYVDGMKSAKGHDICVVWDGAYIHLVADISGDGVETSTLDKRKIRPFKEPKLTKKLTAALEKEARERKNEFEDLQYAYINKKCEELMKDSVNIRLIALRANKWGGLDTVDREYIQGVAEDTLFPEGTERRKEQGNALIFVVCKGHLHDKRTRELLIKVADELASDAAEMDCVSLI